MRTISSQEELNAALLEGGGIVLSPGIYGPIYCSVAKTQIRAKEKWKSCIISDDSEHHGVYMNAPGCYVDGLHVVRAGMDGIKVETHGSVHNCWVENCKHCGISSHDVDLVSIERNLIEYCGDDTQFMHGIYVGGTRVRVHGNVVRHCSAYGIHLYPSLSHSSVMGNIVYGQTSGRAAIIKSAGHNDILYNVLSGREPLTIYERKTSDRIMENFFIRGWPYRLPGEYMQDFWKWE